jgi:hypothetical protein
MLGSAPATADCQVTWYIKQLTSQLHPRPSNTDTPSLKKGTIFLILVMLKHSSALRPS